MMSLFIYCHRRQWKMEHGKRTILAQDMARSRVSRTTENACVHAKPDRVCVDCAYLLYSIYLVRTLPHSHPRTPGIMHYKCRARLYSHVSHFATVLYVSVAPTCPLRPCHMYPSCSCTRHGLCLQLQPSVDPELSSTRRRRCSYMSLRPGPRTAAVGCHCHPEATSSMYLSQPTAALGEQGGRPPPRHTPVEVR